MNLLIIKYLFNDLRVIYLIIEELFSDVKGYIFSKPGYIKQSL